MADRTVRRPSHVRSVVIWLVLSGVFCYALYTTRVLLAGDGSVHSGASHKLVSHIENIVGHIKEGALTPTGTLDGRCYVVPNERNAARDGIKQRCAPSFIIAGAMKCGTTSMYTYLQHHPDVVGVTTEPVEQPNKHKSSHKSKGPQRETVMKPILGAKEVRFFGGSTFQRFADMRGGTAGALQWYYDLFPPIPPPSTPSLADTFPDTEKNRGKIAGEATPMYICTDETAARIRRYLPHVKIIVLLRNPVDRALSEYYHRVSLKTAQHVDAEVSRRSLEEHQEDFDRCVTLDAAVVGHCVERMNMDRGWLTTATRAHKHLLNCTSKVASQMKHASRHDQLCDLGFLRPWCNRASHWPLVKDAFNYTQCLASHGVRNGLYAVQLREWIEQFGNNIMVIPSEEFYADVPGTMRRVEKFLGLAPYGHWDEVARQAFNIGIDPQTKGWKVAESASTETNAYGPMDPSTRKYLLEFYRDSVREMEELIGRALPWHS